MINCWYENNKIIAPDQMIIIPKEIDLPRWKSCSLKRTRMAFWGDGSIVSHSTNSATLDFHVSLPSTIRLNYKKIGLIIRIKRLLCFRVILSLTLLNKQNLRQLKVPYQFVSTSLSIYIQASYCQLIYHQTRIRKSARNLLFWWFISMWYSHFNSHFTTIC